MLSDSATAAIDVIANFCGHTHCVSIIILIMQGHPCYFSPSCITLHLSVCLSDIGASSSSSRKSRSRGSTTFQQALKHTIDPSLKVVIVNLLHVDIVSF